MPTKIDGQYFFTTEEQDELRGYLETENWSEAYRRTAEILDVFWEDEQITQAKLWFEGAYLANTGQGGFSDLIRYYTQRQGQLHFGEAEGAGRFAAYGGDMQLASDEVARRALESILTNKDNREGQVPLLSQLAENDATAVGNVLFARDTADTAFANNAAWSGTPLFSMLGNDQTGLLLRGRDGDSSKVFDTIEDLRNLIFMVDAFDYAVEQAKASWAGFLTGFETFSEHSNTWELISNAITGIYTGDYEDLLLAGVAGHSAYSEIFFAVRQDRYQMVDQLGALFGINVGTTTESNFLTNAYSVFNALESNGRLGLGIVRLDNGSAGDLSTLAAQDTEAGRGYLYSLVNLLPFAVISNHAGTAAADAQYNLNDGDGNRLYSDKYLADKASMLGHVLSRNNQDKPYPSIGTEGEPVYFSDAVTGESFITGQIDLPNNGLVFNEFDVKRVVFGDDADNIASTLQGGEKADRLYGQGGNDTLEGQAGNDYLEGGVGNDTYIFNSGDTADSSDGWDTILDVDGAGSIEWNGTALGNAQQKSEDEPYLFIDQARGISFSFEEGADFNTSQRGILSIKEEGKFGGIKVLNYKLGVGVGELGLNLQTTVVDEQPTEYTQATTVDEPVVDYRAVAQANGAVTPAEFDAFLEADLELTALDGQSNYLIGANGNDRLIGGDGNDHIHLNAGDDFVTGGAGDDIVTGGWGNNAVHTGDGNDVLLMNRIITTSVFTDTAVVLHPDALSINTQNPSPFDFLWSTTTADDTLYTGASNNRYHYAPQITLEAKTWTEGTTVYTTTPNVDGSVVHHQDFANGSAFDGLLLGTYTVTEAGVDPVVHSVGISFQNVVEAEAAFDDLSGGEGNDLIAANEAGDYMVGGAGNDLLMGHGGDDVIEGGADNDGLIGGAGNDILDGGLGEDKLYGEDGNDQLAGGDGDDLLFGDNDLLPEAEHGNDILDGGAGNDTLNGQGGNDALMGGAGDDLLFGEKGDDVLSGGSGSDQLQGGDGKDVLSGDAGNDVLFGEDGDDFLFGGSGVDVLMGGDGNDVLEGGSGDDFLDGEAGADTFVFRPGAGVDVIGDADGSDSLRFISGVSLGAITSQVVYGSNDTFLGVDYGQGDVAIIKDGAEGSVSAYEFSDGSVLSTRQFLSATLEAGVYTSSGSGAPVYGGQYDDTLIGSALAEKLFGADGNDTLAGGGGDDVLEGGEGNDTYLLGHGTGQDLIVGEAGETNTLKLFAGLSVGDLRLERQSNDLFLHLNNSRDGVVIENYYDESKEWTIEDSTGTSTALSVLLGNEQAAVRANSVAEAYRTS